MKSITFKSMSALALALVAGGVMTTTVSAEAKNSEGKIEYTEGGLKFGDNVPSFDFGQQTITDQNETYPVVTAGSLDVKDLRGTNKGWEVYVAQQDQLKSVTSNKYLEGAQLKLNANLNTTVTADSGTVTNQEVTFTPDGSTNLVLKAEDGNGNGKTTLTYADNSDSAQLTVPGDKAKVKEKYQATLEWTLVTPVTP